MIIIFTFPSVTRLFKCLKPIQEGGAFQSAHGGGGFKTTPTSLNCYIYPTIMNLGTVVPHLKKIQKVYKSRDTTLEFR